MTDFYLSLSFDGLRPSLPNLSWENVALAVIIGYVGYCLLCLFFSVLWSLIVLVFKVLLVLGVMYGVFKWNNPSSTASFPDMVLGLITDAGVTIPTYVFNGVARVMGLGGEPQATQNGGGDAPRCR